MMIEITNSQVDMAWGWLGEFRAIYRPGLFYDVMKELGILMCKNCDGLGDYQEIKNFNFVVCKKCNGHGWVHNAK